MQDKVNIIDDINIAQKTVNTRGIKELLSSTFTFPITIPSSNGSPVFTSINIDIPLKESIENYNIISIQFAVDSTYKFKSELNMLNVPEIVYNNTNTYSPSDGSVLFLMDNVTTSVTNSWGGAHMSIRAWFKSPTVMHIDGVNNPFSISQVDKVSITSIKGINIENVTIDPVEYVNTTQGIEDTPVGNIISVMGKTAPSHYLICDGSVHNITDYPYLSQYIKDQFGTFNFFGGDGTETFALPDLRNEFLRGFHGDKTEKLSEEIGVHQSGTIYPYLYTSTNANLNDFWIGSNLNTGGAAPSNIDNTINGSKGIYISQIGGSNRWITTSGFINQPTVYTSRPTNTAVLYCIKYEPTYFMSIQGLIEETILFEGNIGTDGTAAVSNTINLLDSIDNYDKLRVYYYSINNVSARHYDYKEIPKEEIISLINSKPVNAYISCLFGYQTSAAYTNILPVISTHTSLAISQNQSHITKIVGIKYKMFQT